MSFDLFEILRLTVCESITQNCKNAIFCPVRDGIVIIYSFIVSLLVWSSQKLKKYFLPFFCLRCTHMHLAKCYQAIFSQVDVSKYAQYHSIKRQLAFLVLFLLK